MRSTLLLSALLLPGCDSQLKDYLPDVAFDRLEVNSVDWDAADTNFVFKVNNPNPIDITLANFDYSLAFEDQEWLTGDDPDGLVLGAAGSSELSLPVSLNFQDLYDMVQAVRGEDTIGFNLAGSFGFNTPIGLVDIPYDEDGAFPALRTPTFTFKALRVDDVGLTSATLALDLDVDNDHASTLDFKTFDYTFSLQGDDVGTGEVADLGSVDGATTSTLTLPLSIDYGSTGYALYELLVEGSDSVRVGLKADTQVGTPFGDVPLSIDESGHVALSN